MSYPYLWGDSLDIFDSSSSCTPFMQVPKEAILWATAAHVGFGLCNFILTFTNQLGEHPLSTLAATWTSVGCLAIACGIVSIFTHGHYMFQYSRSPSLSLPLPLGLTPSPSEVSTRFVTASLLGTPEESEVTSSAPSSPLVFKDDPWVEAASPSLMLLSFLGSLTTCLGQLAIKIAIAAEPSAAGPLCAVMASAVLVSSGYCYVYYGEALSKKQMGCILVVISGLVFLALSDPSSAHLSGFVAALAAMLGMAASTVLLRASLRRGLSTYSAYVGRNGSTLLFGLIMCTVVHVYELHWTWWGVFLAFLAAVSMNGGAYCGARALKFPVTGVCNAIFESNAVLVLLLNWVFCGLAPSGSKICAMTVILGGIASLAFAKEKTETRNL